jgi:two-component system C4-dicarboxylate transport sensor histidine kinase DctB
MKRRIGLQALIALFAAAFIYAAYLIFAEKARNDIVDSGKRQLQIIALDLGAILERHETLPFVLVFEPDMAQALLHPNNGVVLHRLNQTLQAIQTQAKVASIYLMDRDGKTIASSNWNQPASLSFIGKNYSFRPYFRDAINGKPGRFYAIGNSTNEPGYFISQPVYLDGASPGTGSPIGVIAVKISLSEFESTWARSKDPIALTDQSGVVFLTNRSEWKYHSLVPLEKTVQDHLAETLQYGRESVQPMPSFKQLKHTGYGAPIAQPIDRLGWELMLYPSESRVTRSGLVAAAGAALLLSIIGSSLWARDQRRRRLEERVVSRKALQAAADELEKRIAQRTQDLLMANQNLEIKFAKLKTTEHLLRSTQNELVQAGKLTMLGQMAAGVTHELNQPLAAILAFADNAVTFLSRTQPDKAKENLSHISAAAQRMGAIISQLKGFARGNAETLVTIELSQSIHASALLLENDFVRNGAQLNVNILEEVRVVGDNVRIEQVLINLLRNALDATEDCEIKKVTVTLEREGNDAVIRIRDSGSGIPQQIAEHLFEPFFTTKPPGKGLGLGLAISSSIIQAMNGQLVAQNHAEGGAEFILRLPMTEEINSQGNSRAQS